MRVLYIPPAAVFLTQRAPPLWSIDRRAIAESRAWCIRFASRPILAASICNNKSRISTISIPSDSWNYSQSSSTFHSLSSAGRSPTLPYHGKVARLILLDRLACMQLHVVWSEANGITSFVWGEKWKPRILISPNVTLSRLAGWFESRRRILDDFSEGFTHTLLFLLCINCLIDICADFRAGLKPHLLAPVQSTSIRHEVWSQDFRCRWGGQPSSVNICSSE